MRRLTYTDGRGRVWQLDDPSRALVGTGAALRGWEIPGTGARSERGEPEVSLSVTAGKAYLDGLAEALRTDAMTGRAGTLAYDSVWERRARAVAIDAGTITPARAECSLKLALLDGCWHRERTAQFLPSHADGGTALDMPHDHLHDLGETRRSGRIDTGIATECPVRLTIYGQAVNPRITIGGNVYAFDQTVTTGARLEVDGTGARKTIELVGSDGGRTDAFACGRRGTGRGGGEYCFEPLQPGEQAVQWDGSFGFDLRWWETRGGLPWT